MRSCSSSTPGQAVNTLHPKRKEPLKCAKLDWEQAAGVGNKGRVWYLPHFGVYHPTKPDQIHVVFNLSAEFQGVLLNKELVPGPDLMNSLVGVIIHFRQDNIAMSHRSNVPLISRRPKAPELSSIPLV